MARSGPKPGFRVEERFVENARAFITIRPDDPRWKTGWDTSADVSTLGAFVRLEPPHDASDETVDAMKRAASRKALRVFVVPRRRAAVVRAPKEAKPNLKAREVVEQLVAEAHVDDREELDRLCDEIMARRGL